MKRSISALSVSRARERQVKRFSPKCRHNRPIDVSYCTRFIQRYYLLSLSPPSFSLSFSSPSFPLFFPSLQHFLRNIFFRIPNLLSFIFLRSLTKLRREFYFFPLEILVKCQENFSVKFNAIINRTTY